MADFTTRYKTTFAAQIRVIEPTDTELKEVKASLQDLSAILPPGVNPEKDPQLLYIAANLAVAGVVNLNDDGMDIETALATYKGFEKQLVDVEHNRQHLCGFILHACLTEFGTNRVITEDEARAAGKPFNIATVACLWKVANQALCSYIMEASNPAHSDYKALSLSFEVGYNDYYIVVLPGDTRDLSAAKKTIRREDPEFGTYDKKLRMHKGTGRVSADSTDRVYDVLCDGVIPLGQGVVQVPAAAVKGILAITTTPTPAAIPAVADDQPGDDVDDTDAAKKKKADDDSDTGDDSTDADDDGDDDTSDETDADDDDDDDSDASVIAATRDAMVILWNKMRANQEKIANLSESRVSVATTNSATESNLKSMKKQLAELKSKVASLENPETTKETVANVKLIAEAIAVESERISAELEAEKNRAVEIEKIKNESIAAHAALKVQFDAMKTELDTIRAAQAAAEQEKQFDERMTAIDETFELDNEERAMITDEVKSLDEAAFASWMTKAKKMMKEKTKIFKKAALDAENAKVAAMNTALAGKGVKIASISADKIDFEEIIAAAVVTDPTIPNNVDVNTKSLKEQAAEAFGEMTIGGKKISDYAK